MLYCIFPENKIIVESNALKDKSHDNEQYCE